MLAQLLWSIIILMYSVQSLVDGVAKCADQDPLIDRSNRPPPCLEVQLSRQHWKWVAAWSCMWYPRHWHWHVRHQLEAPILQFFLSHHDRQIYCVEVRFIWWYLLMLGLWILNRTRDATVLYVMQNCYVGEPRATREYIPVYQYSSSWVFPFFGAPWNLGPRLNLDLGKRFLFQEVSSGDKLLLDCIKSESANIFSEAEDSSSLEFRRSAEENEVWMSGAHLESFWRPIAIRLEAIAIGSYNLSFPKHLETSRNQIISASASSRKLPLLPLGRRGELPGRSVSYPAS